MGKYLNPGNSSFAEIVDTGYIDKTGMVELINHYPQLKSIKDCAFYYDDVKIFVCFHILEYCHHPDELEQQIS